MKTNCEKLKLRIPDFLDGTMTEEEKKIYEEEIKSCPEVTEEISSFLKLESEIDSIEDQETPFSMDAKFLRMLEEEENKLTKKPQGQNTVQKFWYVAASISLLLIGFLSGRLTDTNTQNESEHIMSLKNDVKVMKELVMLSMIENQSASERIRAVSYAEEMVQPNQEIIESLIKTLKTDESPNVRLASAEALKKFSSNKVVRAELVKAMETQDDPILQIALINLMVEIEEKSAVKQLRKWSESVEINEVVRKQADLGLQILI